MTRSSDFVKGVIVFVLLACPLTLYLLATGDINQQPNDASIDWISLGTPPAPITQIWSLDHDAGIIAVQTTDDAIYQASVTLCQQSVTDCWQDEITLNPDNEQETVLDPTSCERVLTRQRRLLAPITHCTAKLLVLNPYYTETHFAILENNTVWFWQLESHTTSAGDFIIPAIILFLGVIIVITILLVRRRRKATTSPKNG